MHVSGGNGKQYRSHFRRDWPTGQAFPNLWPYRVHMGSWNLGGFPSDLFDNMQEENTEPGVINDADQTIIYTTTASFLGETATLVITCAHGFNDLQQSWNFLFTDNVHAGFVLILYDRYLLDDESDLWQVTYPMDSGHYSVTAVGEFGGFLYDGPNPLIEMFSATWDQLPPDERFP